MKKIIGIITIQITIALYSCTNDNNILPSPKPYISADAYLEQIGFTGSALIRKGDTTLLRHGFGSADLSTGLPNDPSLIYRIGSITKSFTAAAVVHLKRDGLITSFDQPLKDFYESFPLGNQLTLRHLLTHHSGIPDYVGAIEAYAKEHNHDFEPEEIFEIILENIEEEGLDFTPGEYFSYSNSNYLLLGMLIEELTGKPYQEYLKEKIYDPFQLVQTGKGPNNISGSARAKGYDQEMTVSEYPMQIAFSAGEIESTISDLEKWGDAMMSDYFTTEEKQMLWAPPLGQEGINVPGAGWFTLEIEDQVIYHHGGNIRGFTSFLAVIPESDGLIILLSNQQDKDMERYLIMEAIMKNEF